MAAVAGISSPSSMKKKFTVSAGSAGGGASLGVHSARIAGNERIAAGRLARCRSIVLTRTGQGLHGGDLRQLGAFGKVGREVTGEWKGGHNTVSQVMRGRSATTTVP